VVSVIIPVYRGEKLIERTLDSLAAQTFADFEVLCVDDHSPDGSATIIKERSAKDPRIRYLQTPVNQGTVPKVINCIRDEVRGRYFVYSSQDDYFSADWLEKMVAAMEQGEADAVVPNLEFVTSDGEVLRKASGWDRFGEQTISGKEAFVLSLDWSIPGNALWKSEFLRKYGFFDFGLYADEYTARDYFLKCHRVRFCDGIFYYSQANPDAITKKIAPGRLDYPYNQFRVWELIHEVSPDQGIRFARTVVRDLFEAVVLSVSHLRLIDQRYRLIPAIEGMQSAEFQRDLFRAFSQAEKFRRFAALALLKSATVRALLPLVAIPIRQGKRWFKPSAQAGPSSSSR
jgi:glycosyltransferase involved in cell wall biosynthesis